MTSRDTSPNAFERGKPGTSARDRAEGRIEGVRDLGGVFVEAVRATRLPMVLTDPTLPGDPIVFANQAFLDLSGYSMAEVLGQSPHFMNGPDTDPEDAARFVQILADDQDGVVETIQYAKDGRRFVATVLLSAFKDDAGRAINHFLTWADVTRRVDAEDALTDLRTTQMILRESEAKYRILFDSIDEGFCVVEVLFDDAGQAVDYVFLEANAAFERQTGLVDAVGRRMRDLAPEHEQHWFDIYGHIATTGESRRFERPAQALGRWYDVYAFRIGRPDQRQIAILFEDIGERKRAEQELLRSNALLRTTFDSSAQILQLLKAVRDDQGEIVDFEWVLTNKAWDERWGPNAGKRLLTENPAVVETGVWDKFLAVMESGEPFTHEHYYNHEQFDGWFYQTIAKANDGILLSTLDITDRKRAEIALRESEKRQALLLALGDEMRGLPAAKQKIEAASRLLGQTLGASRVLYAEWDWGRNVAEVFSGWLAGGAQSFPATMQLADHDGEVVTELRAGRTVRVDNVTVLAEKPAYAAIAQLGVKALLSVPLLVDGSLKVNLSIHQDEPRHWTDEEVLLVQEVAERLWAHIVRARAEAALRESEEKYRTIFQSIDEGFVIVELVDDEHGHAIDYRFLETNPAFERQSGLTKVVGRLAKEIAPDLEGYWVEVFDRVSRTGEPQRFEDYNTSTDRWYDYHLTRVGGAGSRRVSSVFTDISERKRNEERLRESEKQQSFLLRLSDELRTHTDERQIESVVLNWIAEELSLDRAYVTTSDYGKGETVVPSEVRRGDLPPLAGIFRHADFPESARMVNEGTFVVHDVGTDANLSDVNRRSFQAFQIGAVIGVGLRRGSSDIFWTFAAAMTNPRQWTQAEAYLLEQVAERTWAAMERARAEAGLRESETRLAGALAAAQLGAFEWTLSNGNVVLDERSREIFGFSAGQGGDEQEVFDSIHPDDFPRVHAAAMASAESLSRLEIEYRIVRPDGAARTITSLSDIVSGPDGQAERMVGVFADVTDRNLAEVALRDSEDRFRTLAESIEDVFYITDLDRGALEYLSPSYEAVWGRPVAELMADLSAFTSTIHPDDLPIVKGGKAAQERGETVSTEYRIVRPDGEVRWVLDRSFPVGHNHVRHSAGVATDITGRKRAEATVRESEERLHTLLTSIPQLVWSAGEPGEWAWASPQWTAYTGQSSADSEGWGWLEMLHPEDREVARTAWASAAASGRFDVEYRIRKAASGEYCWFHTRATPVHDRHGRIKEWFGTSTDIDEIRSFQDALRDSEERLRSFGEASQDVLWIREADTLQWTYLTPAFETIYGISREEALKGDNYLSWLGLVHPEDREHAEERVAQVRKGEPLTFEYRIRRPDGEIRWLRDTDFPIPDAAGNLALFGGVGQDVTGLKQAEAARRESEERLRLIVGNAQDYAIFTTDLDGICTDWREGAEKVFGYSREEMVGRSFDILFTPEDREKGEPANERAIAAAEGKAPDVRWHMRKDGTRVFIDGISTALRGSGGELIGFLKIGQDVTERHAGEARQKLLLEELQHRVRNILGMIRSIVRQSTDDYEDVGEYSAHLSGRLDALARTQVLLTRTTGATVDLEGLVWDELAAQMADDDRCEVGGPPVALSPRAAEVLGLALHELGTNSVKYGALAEAKGRIDIRWSVAPIGADSWLQFVWQEYCAITATEPIRRGFGTELIEQRVPYELAGEATLDITSHGVRAEIAFPLVDGTSVLETGPDRKVDR